MTWHTLPVGRILELDPGELALFDLLDAEGREVHDANPWLLARRKSDRRVFRAARWLRCEVDADGRRQVFAMALEEV